MPSWTKAPRASLAHTPTPLDYLPRLSEALGGPRIYVKRDDATGLAFGGNKTRKLEYLLGDAMDRGCDTILTTGGTQSNHARQTAAAAARCGLTCELLLADAVAIHSPAYHKNGNIFINHLLGATVHVVSAQTDANRALAVRADEIRRDGRHPYIIPAGGTTIIGCLGYVAAARELVAQLDEMNVRPTHIVHATSSGGTHAGLLLGLTEISTLVIGVAVRPGGLEQARDVHRLVTGIQRAFGLGPARQEPLIDDGWAMPGYGVLTPEIIDAVMLAARTEGLLLDPVYTGKTMTAIIDLVIRGELTSDHTVILMHLGGQPALFGYREEWSV